MAATGSGLIYLLVSHTGSGVNRFKVTDTVVGVASRLQLGRLRNHVSICGNSSRLLSS